MVLHLKVRCDSTDIMTKSDSGVSIGKNPYPWYRDRDSYSWFEVRKGKRELRSDIAYFDGRNVGKMTPDELETAYWLVRKKFLEFEYEEDSSITFYATRKRVR